MLAHIHLSGSWFVLQLSIHWRFQRSLALWPAVVPIRCPPSTESPFARPGCYPFRSDFHVTSARVTRPSSLIRAHAPDQNPPADLASAYTAGPCRLQQAPAGSWPFPTLSPRISPWMPGPLPRRRQGCNCPLLPLTHRPSPVPKQVGSLATFCQHDFTAAMYFGAAVIPLCSSLQVCSPPCVAPTPVPPEQSVTFTSEQNTCRYLHVHRICSLSERATDSKGLSPYKTRGLVGRS